MHKILITGSNGLLGQKIVSLFERETNYTLLLTSVEPESYIGSLSSYEQVDITNRIQLKKTVNLFEPDIIINCAAFTDVDRCETERELCWRLNVDTVKNLIIVSRPRNIKIIHFSTDYIFDGKDGPYTEDSVPNPLSFYGRSKLASENSLLSGSVDFVIARTMVLYGTGVKVKNNFALFLVNKLGKNEPVNIVDDQIGNCTMVDDLAYGTLKLVERNSKGIYNIAGKDVISRYEFTLKLCEVFSFNDKLVRPIKTTDLNQPAKRPLKSGLVTFKAESELGYKPMDSFEGLHLLRYQLGY